MMRKSIITLSISLLLFGCQSNKPKQQTNKDCDTCPSLSNEGKIDKPFKGKKKKK